MSMTVRSRRCTGTTGSRPLSVDRTIDCPRNHEEILLTLRAGSTIVKSERSVANFFHNGHLRGRNTFGFKDLQLQTTMKTNQNFFTVVCCFRSGHGGEI